ncbi:MAG: VOC family protein [Ghiorsea sp.]
MSTSLHHVAIIVSDLEQASRLYGDVLGLELDERPDLNFAGLFYKLGHGQQLHLMKLDNPEMNIDKPKHGGRNHHFALQVSDLSPILNKLDGLGLSYTKSLSGRTAAFFYDVDGNAVELIEAT